MSSPSALVVAIVTAAGPDLASEEFCELPIRPVPPTSSEFCHVD